MIVDFVGHGMAPSLRKERELRHESVTTMPKGQGTKQWVVDGWVAVALLGSRDLENEEAGSTLGTGYR